MSKTEFYYKNDEGEKIFLSAHQIKYSYFLYGCQDPRDKGLLYTSYFGTGGTTLTAIYKDGVNIKKVEYAGKEVHETEFKY